MKYLVLAFSLLLTPSMAEATPKPMDFAYGMPLSLDENGAVYRFSVPREIYETVTRDDLADIRVFNGADAVVPHVLRRPKRQSAGIEYSNTLPFFPLYGEEKLPRKEGLSMRVEKSGKQTMIQVFSDDAKASEVPRLSGYIIDAGDHKEPIQEFEVAWQYNDDSFVITVSVESSKDMTHWTSLVPMATLARMQYQGYEISRKRIPIPETRAAFYRLTWPGSRDGMAVTGIRAVRRSAEPDQERQWTALTGQPGKADEKEGITAYEYESPARVPVDRVRLRFTEKNTLVKAVVFSRPDRESPWRSRQSGVFYHLSFEQATLVQDTAFVGPTSDRYWRVAVEEGAFSDPGIIPVVELGWLPHELLFVARGRGPFMVAYGSARLGQDVHKSDTRGPLVQVMDGDKDELLKEAEVMPNTVLGGPDRLAPIPPPMPWKIWLLWGVLVLGVGVIAKMALSLVKGMRQEESG